MKKIFIFMILFFTVFSLVNANFEEDSIKNFVNSTSISDLENIEDPITRFCEETYLIAYMRREFTEIENEICGDFFIKKMEEEYLYKASVLGERGIY